MERRRRALRAGAPGGAGVSVRLRLSTLLREYAATPGVVEVDGGTVRACLDDLARRYPGAARWVGGRDAPPLVLVTLEGRRIPPERFEGPVDDGAELYLLLPLGGG